MSLFLAVACHFIADYPLQSEWMVMNKGKSWEVNLYHAATYAAVFAVMGATPIQTLILCVSHFFIDPLKARWGYVKTIWLDQLLHGTILCVLFV